MGHAIFISYRRDDSEGEAGRLFDDLTGAFGSNGVFMDVAGISPGVDFRKAIDDNVASCGVLLAIIGPGWLTIADSAGKRRLEDANDFVALEISSALKRNVPVIPVLVHDAKMPPADQLPEALKDLAYRNSVELTHTRWNSDCQLLIDALKAYVRPAKGEAGDPVHATVPVQLPPAIPDPPAAVSAAPVRSKTPLIAGICIAIVIAAIAWYFAARPKPSPAPIADGLRGSWVAPHPAEGALDKLQITGSGERLSMQAWGACQPALCDWGTQALTLNGQEGTATYIPVEPADKPARQRTATIRVSPDGGKLDVNIENNFSDGRSPRQNRLHRVFAPAR